MPNLVIISLCYSLILKIEKRHRAQAGKKDFELNYYNQEHGFAKINHFFNKKCIT